MPELPEVETTLRGVRPLVSGKKILELVLRTDKLRFPLDPELCRILPGQTIRKVSRRAKYLLFECDRGTLILHLGMSGSLRVIPADTTENKHDHLDLVLHNGECLRFADPRKFGTFLYTEDDPGGHRLLKSLGPEPLSEEFDADRLFCRFAEPDFGRQAFPDGPEDRRRRREYLCKRSALPSRDQADPTGRENQPAALQGAGRSSQVCPERSDCRGRGRRSAIFVSTTAGPVILNRSCRFTGGQRPPATGCGAPIASLRVAQRSTYYCPRCQS